MNSSNMLGTTTIYRLRCFGCTVATVHLHPYVLVCFRKLGKDLFRIHFEWALLWGNRNDVQDCFVAVKKGTTMDHLRYILMPDRMELLSISRWIWTQIPNFFKRPHTHTQIHISEFDTLWQRLCTRIWNGDFYDFFIHSAALSFSLLSVCVLTLVPLFFRYVLHRLRSASDLWLLSSAVVRHHPGLILI